MSWFGAQLLPTLAEVLHGSGWESPPLTKSQVVEQMRARGYYVAAVYIEGLNEQSYADLVALTTSMNEDRDPR